MRTFLASSLAIVIVASGCGQSHLEGDIDALRGDIASLARNDKQISSRVTELETELKATDETASRSARDVRDMVPVAERADTRAKQASDDLAHLRDRLDYLCDLAKDYYATYATVTIPTGPLAGPHVVHDNFAAAYYESVCR